MNSLQFNPFNLDPTSFNSSLTNGIALITSLIAVSLTESRMGRSRSKTSFVRIFAPVGTIGFLGILKVHIATVVSFEIAKELNLPFQNYSSASRIGSMRKMHRGGIKWDESVNCSAIGMDDTIPLKVSDGFTFVDENQVEYISTEKRVELWNTISTEWDKKRRGRRIFLNLIYQSIFCFVITIGSELAANRRRPSLALFFCASVTLTEIITAIIEYMWTAVSTEAAIGEIIEEDRDENIVESLRIYEQKLRIKIHRSELRLYDINRLVQIRTRGFKLRKKGSFLIDKAKRSLKPPEQRSERNEAVYTKSKAILIYYFFIGTSLVGHILVLCEVLTYALYVTTSFIPQNSPLNNFELEKEALKSFGKWFAVQLLGFTIKAFAPLLDSCFSKLLSFLLSKFHPVLPACRPLTENEIQLNLLRIPGRRESNRRWVKQGRIRAGNTNGILLQTIEQSNSSLPLAHSSVIYFGTNGNENEMKTVVPQVLLVSGLNAREFLDSLNVENPPSNYETYNGRDRFRVWLQSIDQFLNNPRSADERHGFVMVLHFLPYPDRESNEALFVRVAVLELENIKESFHYRIVTSSGVRSGKRAYATDFMVWDGNRTAYRTFYHEATETSVLTFSAAHVNKSRSKQTQIKEALLETRTLDASLIPLPRDWRPPTFDLDGISTAPDTQLIGFREPTPATYHSTLPNRACLFDILEKNQTIRNFRPNGAGFNDEGLNDYGFKYVGRFYLKNCFIHRYHTVITAQGRLTEAHAQLSPD